MSNSRPQQRWNASHINSRLTIIITAGILVVILVATTIMWPLSELGFEMSPETYEITAVEPGSPAARSGLRLGDRVIALYHRPTEVVLDSFFFRYAGKPGTIAPVVVQRDAGVLEVNLLIAEPSFRFQLTKAAFLVLALACLITGYILGVVRRHNVHGSTFASWYWLGIAGLCGMMPLAVFGAPPVLRGIVWLLAVLFVPLSIYVHIHFPHRPHIARPPHAAVPIFGIAWLILGITIGSAYLAGLSAVELYAFLRIVVPLEIIGAAVIIAWILQRSYKHTPVAHTRRQIRLIANTCLTVALINILLCVVPRIISGRTLIDQEWGIVVIGAIPLAYLASGVTPDLYRLDHVVSRLLSHVVTTTVLLIVLTAIMSRVSLSSDISVLLSTTIFITVYRPTHTLVRQLFRWRNGAHGLSAVEVTLDALTRTLDRPALITALRGGIQEAFGRPAIAVYEGGIHGDNTLNLVYQERMPNLPKIVAAGTLTKALIETNRIIESRVFYSRVPSADVTPAEQLLLEHPGIALWCPIIAAQDCLLGLVALGIRSDYDPYRISDHETLQRLMDAAALALAHSAALEQQREAEELIRGLYQRVMQAHDDAARRIARELHSEIINGIVLLNLADLDQIGRDFNDLALRERLDVVISGERTLIDSLRGICEQLYPTIIDQPYGLPDAMKAQIENAGRVWSGQCHLEVQGRTLPLAAPVQQEVLRISQEAVSNAIKHAHASEIFVHLRFPATQRGDVVLEVNDNGQSVTSISAKPGHWGVRTMQESARLIHGTLSFASMPERGSQVRLVFPYTYHIKEDTEAEHGVSPTSIHA